MAKPTRRWARVRRVAFAGLAVGTGVVAVALLGLAGGVVYLRTERGNERLTRELVEQIRRRQVEGGFEVGAIETDLFGRTCIDGASLTDGTGRVVLGAERVCLRYDLGSIATALLPNVGVDTGARAQIDEIVIDRPVVDLVADERGLLDIQRMFGQTEPAPKTDEPWQGLPFDFDADAVSARAGTFRYRAPDVDVRLGPVFLDGTARGTEAEIVLDDVTVLAVLESPGRNVAVLRGGVVYTGDGIELERVLLQLGGAEVTASGSLRDLSKTFAWDLDATVGALDLDAIESLVGKDLKLRGDVAGTLTANGPGDALAVTADLRGIDGSRGTIHADLTVDTKAAHLPWKGTLDLDAVHLDDLYDTKNNVVVLDGTFIGEGRGKQWPDSVEVSGHYTGRAHQVRDITFDSVEGDLRIAGGVLSFTDVETKGPLGDLGASGTLGLVSGELSARATGLVSMPGLEQVGAVDLGGAATVSARVTGNVLAPDLPLAASGHVVLEPFTYGEDVRFERVEADYRWSMRADVQHVEAAVVATDGDLYGTLVRSAESPDAVVDIAPDGFVHVAGTLTGTGVAYPRVFRVDSATGPYAVEVPADRSGNIVHAELAVGSHSLFDQFAGSDGTMVVDLVGDDLAYDVDLDAGERDFVDARGTFAIDDRDVVLEELALSPTPRQSWRGEGVQSFRLTDGGVTDARIAIGAAELGRATIAGTLGTAGPLDATVALEGFELDVLAELFPEAASGLSGEVDLAARLEGRTDAPIVSGTVDGEGLWVPGFSRWLDVEGSFAANRSRAKLDVTVGAAGEPVADLTGTMPVVLDFAAPALDPTGDVQLALALRPGSLERFQWLSEQDLALPPGRASGSLTADGPLRDPDFHLAGVAELDVEGWDSRARIELDVERHGSELEVFSDIREGYSPRVQVSGNATTRIGQIIAWGLGDGPEPDFDDWTLYADELQVKLATLGMPLESLLALAGEPVDAGGELVGGFVISGSPMQPVVAGAVNWVDASLGDMELPGGYFALLPVEGGYDADAHLSFGDEGDIAVTGRVPLAVDLRKEAGDWDEGELALAISGRGVPLAVLTAFDPGVVDPYGVLEVTGDITGTAFDPHPEVRVSAVDGSFGYVPLGILVSDIGVAIEADHRRVRVEELMARTQPLNPAAQKRELRARRRDRDQLDLGLGVDSTVAVSGSLKLQDWQPRGTHLELLLDRALLSNLPDQRLRTSGAIVVSGDWPTLAITGDIEIDDALYVYEESAFAARSYAIDPTLVIRRTGSEVVREPEPEPEPIYRDFTVDVSVDLQRAAEMRASVPIIDEYGDVSALITEADVEARLGGENLRVRMKDGEIQLLNEVEVVDGSVVLFGNELDIAEGSVTFFGDPGNPALDIRASKAVSGGEVAVVISGLLDDPSVEFVSDIYDQTQILTILITGKSPEEMSNTEGFGAQLALRAAFGAIVPQARNFSVEPDGTFRFRIALPQTPDLRGEVVVDPRPEFEEDWLIVTGEWNVAGKALISVSFGPQEQSGELVWQIRF